MNPAPAHLEAKLRFGWDFTIAQIATIPLIFMGGWTGYAIRQGMGLAIPMGFLAFSRGMEQEADYLGLQYMYKAGYDPNSFVSFFEKVTALEKGPHYPSDYFREKHDEIRYYTRGALVPHLSRNPIT